MKKYGQLFFSLVGVALIIGACASPPEQRVPEAVAQLIGEMEVAPKALELPVFPSEFLGSGKAPEPRRNQVEKPVEKPRTEPVIPPVRKEQPQVKSFKPNPPKSKPPVQSANARKDPYANTPKPERPLNLGCQNWIACPAIHLSEISTKEARLNDKKELIQDPAITPKQRLRLKMELSKLQNDIDDLRAKLREKCMDC